MTRGIRLNSRIRLLGLPILAYLVLNGAQVINDVSYMAPQRTLQLGNARLSYPEWLTRDDAGHTSSVRLELTSPLPAPARAPTPTLTHILTATDGLLFIDQDGNTLSSVLALTLSNEDRTKSVLIKQRWLEIWDWTTRSAMIEVAQDSGQPSPSASVRLENLWDQLMRKFRALIFSQGGAIVVALGLLVQQFISQRMEVEKERKKNLRELIAAAISLPADPLIKEWCNYLVSTTPISNDEHAANENLSRLAFQTFRARPDEFYAQARWVDMINVLVATADARASQGENLKRMKDMQIVLNALFDKAANENKGKDIADPYLAGFFLNMRPPATEQELRNWKGYLVCESEPKEFVHGIVASTLCRKRIQPEQTSLDVYERLIDTSDTSRESTHVDTLLAEIVLKVNRHVLSSDKWSEAEWACAARLGEAAFGYQIKAKFSKDHVFGRTLFPVDKEFESIFGQTTNSDAIRMELNERAHHVVFGANPGTQLIYYRLMEIDNRSRGQYLVVNLLLPYGFRHSSTIDDHLKILAASIGNELFAHFCEVIRLDKFPTLRWRAVAEFLAKSGYRVPGKFATLCQYKSADYDVLDIDARYDKPPFNTAYRAIKETIQQVQNERKKTRLASTGVSKAADDIGDIERAVTGAGLEYVYVLIGGLDDALNQGLMTADQCAKMLGPLAGAARTFSQHRIYFKLFLPEKAAQILLREISHELKPPYKASNEQSLSVATLTVAG